MRAKTECERAGLRLNIKKIKIMEFSPSTAWQIEVEKVEAVTDFLFLDSKITADSDCSHEIRRPLLLGRKAMRNLDIVLKNRDLTLLTKVCIVKAMVFPVVTYGYGSWMIKKAECQRIDAFELWCWRRLLKIPWRARRSNQSILREINAEYSLERLMLKLQYFGHLMKIDNSLKKSLMLGKTEGRRGCQRKRWLDGIIDAMTMNLDKLWEILKDRRTGRPGVLPSMGLQAVRQARVTEQQQSSKYLSKTSSKTNVQKHFYQGIITEITIHFTNVILTQ